MIKASLLLVDDDRQVLESMADWLREQGYQLDVAGSVGRDRRDRQKETTTSCWRTFAWGTATASTCWPIAAKTARPRP